MKNICVFLSSSDLAEKYTKPAKELAKLLVHNNYGFVYGGSHTGLMKVMASTVQKAGGTVIGITTEYLKDRRKLDADEMIIAKDLAERKHLFRERSNGIVVMPGGIGTLDEITDILELKKHNLYNKPIVFLNTDNFYNGLKTLLERMGEEGFIPKRIDEMVFFAKEPEEVIEFLKKNL